MTIRSVEDKYYYDLAVAYDAKLPATDSRLRRAVKIITDDGASLFYEDAFLMRKDKWIFLFAEHHMCEVFHEDDLLWYADYDRRYELENMPEKEVSDA